MSRGIQKREKSKKEEGKKKIILGKNEQREKDSVEEGQIGGGGLQKGEPK
jgi:hypothetical protein